MHKAKLLEGTVLGTNCSVKEAEPAKVAVVHGLPRSVDCIPPKLSLSQFDFKQRIFIDKEQKTLKHLLLLTNSYLQVSYVIVEVQNL